MRVGAVAVIGSTVFTVLGVLTLDSVPWVAPFSQIAILVIPLALGREVYQRRRRLQEMEERAIRAEQEREQRARDAVASERLRIARELHDVVAHQMAVMTIQAEGARRVANGADPRIGEALDVIRDSGHNALTEMRRMVGLLRTDAADADLGPQPGLGSIAELARAMADSGLPVEVRSTGEARQMPAGVDINAYRIVQESLTNALKHGGPGTSARVTLAYDEGSLSIEVEDDGRGAAAPPSESGHGISGMQERVAVVDGAFESGPRPGGGYRVRATLPVQS
jgi:signal transduction histidine kinase